MYINTLVTIYRPILLEFGIHHSEGGRDKHTDLSKNYLKYYSSMGILISDWFIF